MPFAKDASTRDAGTTPISREVDTDEFAQQQPLGGAASSWKAAKGHPQGVPASCVFGTASPTGMGPQDGEGHMEAAH